MALLLSVLSVVPSSQPRRSSTIVHHVEGWLLTKYCLTVVLSDLDRRRKFILKLAKALLSYGAPSHRIEYQLSAASEILGAQAAFVHIPNVIMVTLGNGGSKATRTYFVRAGGRIALSYLHEVHQIYHDVLHWEPRQVQRHSGNFKGSTHLPADCAVWSCILLCFYHLCACFRWIYRGHVD
jgi:hypothetical protein